MLVSTFGNTPYFRDNISNYEIKYKYVLKTYLKMFKSIFKFY